MFTFKHVFLASKIEYIFAISCSDREGIFISGANSGTLLHKTKLNLDENNPPSTASL